MRHLLTEQMFKTKPPLHRGGRCGNQGIMRLILPVLLMLTACTQFPELDARITPELRDADYPTLAPLEPLLATRTAPANRAETIAGSVTGRVSALQSRAARLRGPVLSRTARSRLAQQPGA